MSVHLTGTRRCGSCRRVGRVSNAFTNGVGWRELCDPCVERPCAALLPKQQPALPALRRAAR